MTYVRNYLIAGAARERYRFFERIFTLKGDSVTGNLYAARVLAARMNLARDLSRFPERAVTAGQLYTMGLIEEILHWIIRRYVQTVYPAAFAESRGRLDEIYSAPAVDRHILLFTGAFPPPPVFERGLSPAEYLAGGGDMPPGLIMLEENILVLLANRNPAYTPYRELHDDSPLAGRLYEGLFGFFHRYFLDKPPFGPHGQSLMDMLLAPMTAAPESIEKQLEYMLANWGELIAPFIHQILTSLDIIREEKKPAFAGFDGLGFGAADLRAALAGEGEGLVEYERYSDDREWMARVVLLAKSVYVWLHQLSVKYGLNITRLDQIPDAELERLAKWGFTGLWLIGVWERSPASKEIKRRCGNPEAESSAYSLYDYTVAEDLGGEAALRDLRSRAWRFGIRLAADMVPNHVGIYSKWVIEHPHWFIQTQEPPFPAYRYNGPDLSSDPSVCLQIEDGYWDRRDAAVAFRRLDRNTGENRYIYHGNDGTGLPWNDTAQLNYLLPEVREAAVNAILHVARMFPIIRFDAAMTLTKRHYQRLWFPPPGAGGDIPSRAGHGMSGSEFSRRLPEEFWREVVDRAAREAPDTLLLAEAFWLMEGYFVRTLGMHRVYNSAFMNMLKREANAEYRQTLKNVLEFDPAILQRFVNFMNNPDEETAVAQFGKDDKYFGTAVMLATLPGLPMFGHGQIEGFTERYGMEYRRSYYDESPDENLIRRHEREIFPLLRRRHIFAGAEHFTLYDFWRDGGSVDENVFAYSNRHGGDRALVVYNNVYGGTSGWIRDAAAVLVKTESDRFLLKRNLGDELGLPDDPSAFCVFRDVVHGLEYIRRASDLRTKGLHVILNGFQYHVFLDFRMVGDAAGDWDRLERFLGGRGVESISGALRRLLLTPVHAAFRSFFNRRELEGLLKSLSKTGFATSRRAWDEGFESFAAACRAQSGRINEAESPTAVSAANRDLEAAVALAMNPADRPPQPAKDILGTVDGADSSFTRIAAAYAVVKNLSLLSGYVLDGERSLALLDEWLLNAELTAALSQMGAGDHAEAETLLVRVLVGNRLWLPSVINGDIEPTSAPDNLMSDVAAQKYLGFNRYRGSLWYNKERFENLMAWLHMAYCLEEAARSGGNDDCLRLKSDIAGALTRRFIQAAAEQGYRVRGTDAVAP